jgi:hypothetical protein
MWVTASCSLCGRVADPAVDGDPPLGWCADLHESMDGPYTRWVCVECTRRHVRSIEAKLDEQFWY